MTANMLQLNHDMIEAIVIQSSYSLRKLGHPQLSVGGSVIAPSSVVRNLGVMLDEHLTMHSQVSKTVQVCNIHLRNIARVRPYLTREACQTAVQALVISRMDYCCSLLCNITGEQLRKLQIVQNRAAKLITGSHPRDHVKPILAELHWLPVHLRIQFRVLVYTFKCLHDLAPP